MKEMHLPKRNSVLQVRVNSVVKDRALAHLNKLGLSISEYLRLKIAELAYPVEDLRPSAETLEAIKYLNDGKGATCKNSDELFKLLGVDK